MTATTTLVRRRTAARRNALARQQKLNEERQRRDEQELDLAAEFAVLSDEYATARAAVHTAEQALGRVVDTLIGGLRIRYERAAQLLDTAEDELKRLRQVATDDAAGDPTPAAPQPTARPPRRARTRPAPPLAVQPATAGTDDDRNRPGHPGDEAAEP